MEIDQNIIMQGSLEWNDYNISYKVLKKADDVVLEASFTKTNNTNKLNNSTMQNQNFGNDDKAFIFENNSNNIFILQDPTSKINLSFDLKNEEKLSIKTTNIPLFKNLSLSFNKKSEEMIFKIKNEKINLSEKLITNKTNINMNRMIEYFGSCKNSNIGSSLIITRTLENILASMFKKMDLPNPLNKEKVANSAKTSSNPNKNNTIQRNIS